jgi:hypothetical protein
MALCEIKWVINFSTSCKRRKFVLTELSKLRIREVRREQETVCSAGVLTIIVGMPSQQRPR